jgi:NitT/TauT family transport system substrate-binding protein
MRRSLFMAAPLALLTACGGGGNSADADPANPVSVDFATSASNALPWLVADGNGDFEKFGVTIGDLDLGDGGSSTLRAALAGGAPIAEVSFAAAVEAIDQGAEIEIVSGSLSTAVGVDFYALADNSAIQTIEDVETIGVTNPGSISETVTRLALDELGLAQPEYVQTGGIGEGVALLESGEVDATFITPPVAATMGDKIREILRASDELGTIQTSVIVATKEYAEEHPKAVEGVIAALPIAAEQIATDPEAAAAIWAPKLDAEPGSLRPYIDRIDETDNVWGIGFDTKALDRAVEALKLTGYEGEVDFCSILTDAYLPDGAPRGPLQDC